MCLILCMPVSVLALTSKRIEDDEMSMERMQLVVAGIDEDVNSMRLLVVCV